jgi:hypothetical protein
MGSENTYQDLQPEGNKKLLIHLTPEYIDQDLDQGDAQPAANLKPPIVFICFLHAFSQGKSIR